MTSDFETIEQEYLEERKNQIEQISALVKPHLLNYQSQGITKIKVYYDGGADDGDLEDITFYQGEEEVKVTEIHKSEDLDSIFQLSYLFLPMGWEINWGSCGFLYFDLTNKDYCQASIEHIWEAEYEIDHKYEDYELTKIIFK